MTVTLINHMGDDLSVCNAARVSYAKESRWEYFCSVCNKIPDWNGYDYVCRTCNAIIVENDGSLEHRLNTADAGLINYLMKNRHGTPFEMVQLQFRVRVPIFVAREWQRHRIGSYNEVSTRYVEMEPEFYVPAAEHIRVQLGKPGHYIYEQAPEELAKMAIAELQVGYQNAYETYRVLLSNGIAREIARNVLPLALMTEFIWSVNLRSLFNFVSLRTHPTALLEIRLEAQEVEKLARTIVPTAMEAFDNNGRIAP